MKLGKYIAILMLYLLIPYIIGGVVFLLQPKYYFTSYPFIILVFLAMGLPFYGILSKSHLMPQRKFFMWFMGHTFFKLIMSMIIILLYIFFVKQQIASFLVVFLVFYLVLLAFETRLFTKLSKQMDKK